MSYIISVDRKRIAFLETHRDNHCYEQIKTGVYKYLGTTNLKDAAINWIENGKPIDLHEDVDEFVTPGIINVAMP